MSLYEWMIHVKWILTRRQLTPDDLEPPRFWEMAYENGLSPESAVAEAEK